MRKHSLSVARLVKQIIRFSSALILSLGLNIPAQATVFGVTNLVTDDQGVNAAQITDGSLKNAWGISSSSTGPFWVSDNGTGLSTIYAVNPATNATTKSALTVAIPGDGSITGQVFNSTSGSGRFNSDNFLFVSEDGTISGWRGALGTTAETLASPSLANVYKGAAFGTIGANSYLYAANFRAGTIDVTKGNGAEPNLTGNFVDPNIPAGYAPFNIQNLGGALYVTYALQDGTKHDEIAGPGNGFVSVFDLNGNFLGRVASGGTLNAPWGLAIAPSSFGAIAGDLLVDNFGDGRINAIDLGSDTFLGQLLDTNNIPISIDGLWELTSGNGGNGGSTNSIYFSAGPNDEQNGLFGVITPVPEPATLALLALGIVGLYFSRLTKANTAMAAT